MCQTLIFILTVWRCVFLRFPLWRFLVSGYPPAVVWNLLRAQRRAIYRSPHVT